MSRKLFTWLLVLVAGSTISLAGQADKRLDVYWVDVEGGAATLMVMPTGESVLVDTGNPGLRDAQRIFDVATRVAGLRQIDHLLITHYHGDHFGGAATLSELLPIKTVYDNGQFEGGRERPSKAYLEFKAEKRQVISPGESIKLRGADDPQAPRLELKCLGARQQFVAAMGSEQPNPVCAECKQKDRDISDNANSIVLLLSFGPFRLFDAGDLTWNMEEKLICPVNLVGEVDVYQVTHHGLDTSNNPVLVRSLAPRVAIMNNGVTKGCQPDTFQALKNCPSIQAIYQGHKNMRPDGSLNNAPDEYIANLEAMCAGNYIKLSVDPAGRSYTVSIPAKGHERSYEAKSSKP
jgi:beta-lactamase superfamily II metal-dependent hydrolase